MHDKVQGQRSETPRTTALILLIVALASPASAQTIAITGGKVFPVSAAPIENGTIVITDGKIVAVGATVAVPPGARTIDAKGKWITPGFINAATQLGVREIDLVPSTVDTTARGERAIAAGFRVWDGLNPASPLWSPARNEGITGVVVLPAGGLVSGQAAFVDTGGTGTSTRDVLRKAPVAMVAQLGAPPLGELTARGEELMRLRELLEDARVYAVRKTAFETGATRDFAAGRLHLAALVPVVQGQLPLLLGVDRASDIEAALDLAREYKVKLIVLGGAEGWMVADKLAAAKVPVVTGAQENIPLSFSSLGARQENAALLRKAGVSVIISAGAVETFNVRNVRQHAGNAVAYGLSWDEALRAVTQAPAEAFGVGASLGSLTAGRDANLVVWDGDPFEFTTQAVHVFVKGRDVRGTSRQDLLIERYKTKKPPER